MPSDLCLLQDAIQVEVEGGALPLWTFGSGPTLLFLHGWMLDARIWRPQIAALAARFRIACFDRRGFGHATAPPDPAKEVEDIGALVDVIGVDKVGLVAMSQGARSALAFAAHAPQRLSGMVLAGAPLPFPQTADIAAENLPMAAMRTLAQASDLDAMRKLALDSDLLHLPGAPPQAQDLIAEVIGDYCARDLLSETLPLQIAPSIIAQIDTPTLLIVGERDTPMRRYAAEVLERTMMQAQRHDITGAGHICSLSHPAMFNIALENFLSAH